MHNDDKAILENIKWYDTMNSYQKLEIMAKKLNVRLNFSGDIDNYELYNLFNWLLKYQTVANDTFDKMIKSKSDNYDFSIDNDLDGEYKLFLEPVTYINNQTEYAINQSKLERVITDLFINDSGIYIEKYSDVFLNFETQTTNLIKDFNKKLEDDDSLSKTYIFLETERCKEKLEKNKINKFKNLIIKLITFGKKNKNKDIERGKIKIDIKFRKYKYKYEKKKNILINAQYKIIELLENKSRSQTQEIEKLQKWHRINTSKLMSNGDKLKKLQEILEEQQEKIAEFERNEFVYVRDETSSSSIEDLKKELEMMQKAVDFWKAKCSQLNMREIKDDSGISSESEVPAEEQKDFDRNTINQLDSSFSIISSSGLTNA